MSGLDIKQLRESRKISQQQLAALLGVSEKTIQNWEAGKVIPKTKQAIIMSLMSGNNSGTVINGQNHISNSTISTDNRQYYSDSPDVLRAQIDILDERIKEKDAQIKEKDAQINRLLDILASKS